MAIIIKPKNIYETISNNKVVDNDITKINYNENIVKSSGSLPTRSTALPLTLYQASDEMEITSSPLTFTQSIFQNRNPNVANDYTYEYVRNDHISYTFSTSPTGLPIDQYSIIYKGDILNLANNFDMEGNYNCSATFVGNFPYSQVSLTTGVTTEVKPNEITSTISIPIAIYNTFNEFRDTVSPILNPFPIIMENKPFVKIGIIKEGSNPTSGGNLKFAMIIEYDRKVNKYIYTDDNYLYTSRMFLKTLSYTIASEQFTYDTISTSVGSGIYDFSLNDNELFQPNSTITIDGTTQKISTYLSNNIIEKWTNGKETATLLVDYGEYYDENGTLVKSIKDTSITPLPMQFYRGDIVRPYVSNLINGSISLIETPLSKKQNGQPKDFLVVGVETIYDGACWQRLTLLEN